MHRFLVSAFLAVTAGTTDLIDHALAPVALSDSLGPTRRFDATFEVMIEGQNYTFNISGIEPIAGPPAPVYLYTAHLGSEGQGVEDMAISGMAARGFVAAWTTAINTPHNCSRLAESECRLLLSIVLSAVTSALPSA